MADICGKLEGEQRVGNDMQGHQELFWRKEPDMSSKDSSAKLRELQEDPWKRVTDVRDWKELIQKKTLHSTRTSVKICASNANPRVATNDEVRHGFITVVNPSLIQVKASRTLDKRVTDTSSQMTIVSSATNSTIDSSSLHVGSRDANLGVPAAHGTEFTDTAPIPSQMSIVDSATNSTIDSSSLQVGSRDANLEVPAAPGTESTDTAPVPEQQQAESEAAPVKGKKLNWFQKIRKFFSSQNDDKGK